VAELTQITFLLLMVTFTDGAPARVEVVGPGAVKKGLLSAAAADGDGLGGYMLPATARVSSRAGSYVYDASIADPFKRFYRSSGHPFPVSSRDGATVLADHSPAAHAALAELSGGGGIGVGGGSGGAGWWG